MGLNTPPSCKPCPPVVHPCCFDGSSICSDNAVDNFPDPFSCVYEGLPDNDHIFGLKMVEVYCPASKGSDIYSLSSGPKYENRQLYNLDHNLFNTRSYFQSNQNTYNNKHREILSDNIRFYTNNVINYESSTPYNIKDLYQSLNKRRYFLEQLNLGVQQKINLIKERNSSGKNLYKKIITTVFESFMTKEYTSKVLDAINLINNSSMSAPSFEEQKSTPITQLRFPLHPKKLGAVGSAVGNRYAQRELQLLDLIPEDINLRLKVHTKDGCSARIKIQNDKSLKVYRVSPNPPIVVEKVSTQNEFLTVFPFYSDCRGAYMFTKNKCCTKGCRVHLCGERQNAYGLDELDKSIIFNNSESTAAKEAKIDLYVESSGAGISNNPEFNTPLNTQFKEWYFYVPDKCSNYYTTRTEGGDTTVKITDVNYIKVADSSSGIQSLNQYIKHSSGYGGISFVNIDDPFLFHIEATSTLSATFYDPNIDNWGDPTLGIYPRRVLSHLLVVPCNKVEVDPLRGRSTLVSMDWYKVKRKLEIIPSPIIGIKDITYLKMEKAFVTDQDLQTGMAVFGRQGTDLTPIRMVPSFSVGYFKNLAYDNGIQPDVKEHIFRKIKNILASIGTTYNLSVFSNKIKRADLWKLIDLNEYARLTLELKSHPDSIFFGGLMGFASEDVLSDDANTTHLKTEYLINNQPHLIKVMDTIPRVE